MGRLALLGQGFFLFHSKYSLPQAVHRPQEEEKITGLFPDGSKVGMKGVPRIQENMSWGEERRKKKVKSNLAAFDLLLVLGKKDGYIPDKNMGQK